MLHEISVAAIRSAPSFGTRKTDASHFLVKENEEMDPLAVDLSGMRDFKERDAFTEDQLVAKEPIAQFKSWFDLACATPGIRKPNYMCLATCTRDGKPSARCVLLKGFGKYGFKFYTNYNSRKGNELRDNPNGALLIYWEPLCRTIRIEGTMTKLSPEESTEYFQSRPKDSQIGATCSHQSAPISSRSELMRRANEVRSRYPDTSYLPRPEEWGGFILKPHTVEFWQGQKDCLHDRIRFRIPKPEEVADGVFLHEGEEGWVYERLQP